MSHLHIPDGVLPVWLWAPAAALALLLLVLATRARRHASPQQLAYQASLGGLVLAAMAIQVPLGPLEYHLALVGPVGVLLGPAAGFQVVFVASAVLAFVGHGGFTVVGLNALVLGAGVTIARPLYELFAGSRTPALSMSLATALGQAVSGVLWFAVVLVALRFGTWTVHTAHHATREGFLLGIAAPLWLVGVVVESAVAFGLARFIARVRPDLLPRAFPRAAREAEGAA